jgi:hypothetical protein
MAKHKKPAVHPFERTGRSGLLRTSKREIRERMRANRANAGAMLFSLLIDRNAIALNRRRDPVGGKGDRAVLSTQWRFTQCCFA